MNLHLDEINWLAVAAAALATFMLGGLWYTALFGKAWVRLNGYSEEKVKQMQADRPPPVFFGTMLVCYFLVALVMAVLVAGLGLDSAAAGAGLGALVWLGLAAAIGMTGHIASDRHIGTYAIDASYQFVFLVMTGVILAVWR